MKNPITFFLFLVFAFVNLLDIGTALFIGPAESNPLYILFDSFIPLIFLKIGVVWLIFFFVKRNIYPSNFMYYLIILILTLGTLAVSLGVYSNVLGIINPEYIEQGAQMSGAEKVRGYGLFISIIYFIPAIFNLIMFALYDKSIGKAIIDKEYFSKSPWWRL